MIAIVDYGMGNLRSVLNALAAAGGQGFIARDPKDLAAAAGIILPGVGAFGSGMANLRRGGFLPALEREVMRDGKPLLGLCLGMQLLADRSTEHGHFAGLGWIAGEVELLPSGGDGTVVRVPHVGWNDVQFRGAGALFHGMGDGATFYFVHSYVLRPASQALVTGVCAYGNDFAASVQYGNLHAVQFHPEKSHRAGQAVLRNFVKIVTESHAEEATHTGAPTAKRPAGPQ